jgi:hypothetical protein
MWPPVSLGADAPGRDRGGWIMDEGTIDHAQERRMAAVKGKAGGPSTCLVPFPHTITTDLNPLLPPMAGCYFASSDIFVSSPLGL